MVVRGRRVRAGVPVGRVVGPASRSLRYGGATAGVRLVERDVGAWRGVSPAMLAVLGMVAEDADAGLSAASATACARVLGVSGIGVRVGTGGFDGGWEPVWSTGALTRGLDDLEFTLGEGPNLDAATGVPVLVADVAQQSRWPVYGPAAYELGARAVFALPLSIGAIGVGVLGAYRTAAGPLNEQQVTDAVAFADAATWLLLDLGGPHASVPPRWLAGMPVHRAAPPRPARPAPAGAPDGATAADGAEEVVVISPYVRRRRLASEIIRLREDHGYSAERLAKAIGVGRQRIRGPNKSDLGS